tara:strand:+ start:540 stop:1058 length:519 start_codon:yes stop_codon:yes gene_type:complete
MAEKKKSFGNLIARKLFGGKARTAKKDREKKEYDERKKKAESKYPKKLTKLTKNTKEARRRYESKLEDLFDWFRGPGGDGATAAETAHWNALEKSRKAREGREKRADKREAKKMGGSQIYDDKTNTYYWPNQYKRLIAERKKPKVKKSDKQVRKEKFKRMTGGLKHPEKSKK